jgi:hypothetical protein
VNNQNLVEKSADLATPISDHGEQSTNIEKVKGS